MQNALPCVPVVDDVRASMYSNVLSVLWIRPQIILNPMLPLFFSYYYFSGLHYITPETQGKDILIYIIWYKRKEPPTPSFFTCQSPLPDRRPPHQPCWFPVKSPVTPRVFHSTEPAEHCPGQPCYPARKNRYSAYRYPLSACGAFSVSGPASEPHRSESYWYRVKMSAPVI